MRENFVDPSTITIKNYPEIVARFCSDLPLIQHNAHMALGLADEYFELEKAHQNNDKTNQIEEAGDSFWYLALLCLQNNISFLNVINIGNDSDMTPHEFASHSDTINWAKAKLAGYTKTFTNEQVFVFFAQSAAYIISRCPDNVSIEEILRKNYMKLANRHGASFNPDNGQSRNIEAERAILEA